MNTVLDTNVLLAALHFADPTVLPLWHEVRSGALVWHATAAMHEEMRHVAHRLHGAEPPWLVATLALSLQTDPAPAAPATRLWCRDPADQMFIDLALSLPPPVLLFSRDKALRALARRARARGVQILPPEAPASAWDRLAIEKGPAP